MCLLRGKYLDRRIKISVGGCEDVADIVRENLRTINQFEIINHDTLMRSDEDLSATNLWEIIKSDTLRKSDIIYWVYGRGPSIKNFFPIWIKKYPIIINHWIGSDILWETNDRSKNYRINPLRKFIQDCIVRWKIKMGGLIDLTTAPWLVAELSDLHIKATNLPITTIDINTLGPVDIQNVRDIDFLSYVPFRSFEFYGGAKLIQLAQRWQNYKFLIICVDLDEIPLDFVKKFPENVTISPQVNPRRMSEFYQRSKYFIRYTQHDAISLSVLESLYFKLQVLWTYDFPFTQKIENQEKLSDSIPALIQNWHPNEDGHAFVIENYSIERWRANFLEIIKTKTTLLK
jgi:hypothetical protein